MSNRVPDAPAGGTRRRIGFVIPSSNTVVEPETHRILAGRPDASAHFSRIPVINISGSAASLAQFETDRTVAAARLLADAGVDRLAWAGTAASWLGFGRDERLVQDLERATGITATTSLLAINGELRSMNARRIGLVTPYVADLETRIIANYRAIAIDVVGAARLDLTDNRTIAEVTEDAIETMARAVAGQRPEAIVIMCTNLRFAVRSATVGKQLGLRVIDSVAATVRACLD